MHRALTLFLFLIFVSSEGYAGQDSRELLEFIGGASEPNPSLLADAEWMLSKTSARENLHESLERIHEVLVRKGFQRVEISADRNSMLLTARLFHARISEIDRGVGRAARIIDFYAPDVISKFKICYYEGGIVITVCYEINRGKLGRYLKKLMSRWQLAHHVKRIKYSSTEDAADTGKSAPDSSQLWVDVEPDLGVSEQSQQQSRDIEISKKPQTSTGEVGLEMNPGNSDLSIGSDSTGANPVEVDNDLLVGLKLYQDNTLDLQLKPIAFGRYLNNKDGDFYIDLKTEIAVDAYIGNDFLFHASVFYRWNSPDDAQASNSEFQHVRSDIDLYRDVNEPKIDRMYLSYTTAIGNGSYFNASAGYQEEMFGGLSTQFYHPNFFQNMDFDLRVDWLKQRDIDNPQEFGDYDVTSILMGFQFRWSGVFNEINLYAGRFLAKDEGLRLDVGHRYSNGVRIAFWYSHTNEDDEVHPGSSGSPYRGRGITINVPLNALRNKDTREVYDFEYVPHLRDTAQMLDRPVDISRSLSGTIEYGSVLRGFGQ
jgi:hypothetical protein